MKEMKLLLEHLVVKAEAAKGILGEPTATGTTPTITEKVGLKGDDRVILGDSLLVTALESNEANTSIIKSGEMMVSKRDHVGLDDQTQEVVASLMCNNQSSTMGINPIRGVMGVTIMRDMVSDPPRDVLGPLTTLSFGSKFSSERTLEPHVGESIHKEELSAQIIFELVEHEESAIMVVIFALDVMLCAAYPRKTHEDGSLKSEKQNECKVFVLRKSFIQRVELP
ncbi:hypothetical protein V6N11_019077 [Hibiscus sabdariffa]|uniref:Uncharacterized protein n=1 Tax=Hibiscus sabdariffa TaxID=183260 RepID=A0ABR2R1K1_9ROSI